MTHVQRENENVLARGSIPKVEHAWLIHVNDPRLATISTATLHSVVDRRRSLRLSLSAWIRLMNYPTTWKPCGQYDEFRVHIQLTNLRGDGPRSEEVLAQFAPNDHRFQGEQ